MADNLTAVLRELISGMDKRAMNNSIPQLKKLLSTPEGRELTEKIKSTDRETLLKLIGEIKPNVKNGIEGIADKPGNIKRLIDILDGRE